MCWLEPTILYAPTALLYKVRVELYSAVCKIDVVLDAPAADGMHTRHVSLLLALSIFVAGCRVVAKREKEEVFKLRMMLQGSRFGQHSPAEVDCAACEAVAGMLVSQLSKLGDASQSRQVAQRGRGYGRDPVIERVCLETRYYSPMEQKQSRSGKVTRLRFFDFRSADGGDEVGIRELKEYCAELLDEHRDNLVQLSAERDELGKLTEAVCVRIARRCTAKMLRTKFRPLQAKSKAKAQEPAEVGIIDKDEI